MPLTKLFSVNSQTILVGLQKVTKIRPTVGGVKTKKKIKFETEKYICTKNKTLNEFYQKWSLLFTV